MTRLYEHNVGRRIIMQKMTLNRHPNSLLFKFVDSREVWSTILGKPKVMRNETLFDDGYDCADITRVHDHFNYVLHFFTWNTYRL